MVFRMIGRIINGIGQGREAANAATVIQELTGKPCTSSMIDSLQRLSESATQFGLSDTKYDYAFQVLFNCYLNEELRDYDDEFMQNKLRLAAEDAINAGLITNSYVINLYAQ